MRLTDAAQGGAVFTLVLPIEATEHEPPEEDVTRLDSQVEHETEELPTWHGS